MSRNGVKKRYPRKSIYGDRFIPLRQNFSLSEYIITKFEENSHVNACCPKNKKYVNFARYLIKREEYERKLWEIMFNKKKKAKILNYSSKKKDNGELCASGLPDWPVKPRKKSCISAPLIIMDMPGIDYDITIHACDWSFNGHLAVVYRREVFLWFIEEMPSYKITKTDKRAKNCIRWSKDGNLLAIALYPGGFSVYNIIKDDVFKLDNHEIYGCACKTRPCRISCFAWKANGTLFTGCSKGIITKHIDYEKNMFSSLFYMNVSNAVINIEFSAREIYAAILTSNGDCYIVEAADSTPIIKTKTDCFTTSLAWHPWNDSIFVYSNRSVFVKMLNVVTLKVLEWKIYPNTYVDGLSFNPLSAELVLSVRNLCNPKINTIFIMSSFDVTVDIIQWHTGAVQYLLWSPDRTQLATVDENESMCIWDFFGNRTKSIRKFFSKPTASALDFNGFGTTIR